MLTMTKRQNQIKGLILRRGLTIYSFAKKVGLPHHQIKRIADSEQIPDGVEYKTLRALADALGVGLSDLDGSN